MGPDPPLPHSGSGSWAQGSSGGLGSVLPMGPKSTGLAGAPGWPPLPRGGHTAGLATASGRPAVGLHPTAEGSVAQEALGAGGAVIPEPQGEQVSPGLRGREASPPPVPEPSHLQEGLLIHLLQKLPDPAAMASHSLQVAPQPLLLISSLCQHLRLGHVDAPQCCRVLHFQGP